LSLRRSFRESEPSASPATGIRVEGRPDHAVERRADVWRNSLRIALRSATLFCELSIRFIVRSASEGRNRQA
jgi:hypothetical protein